MIGNFFKILLKTLNLSKALFLAIPPSMGYLKVTILPKSALLHMNCCSYIVVSVERKTNINLNNHISKKIDNTFFQEQVS